MEVLPTDDSVELAGVVLGAEVMDGLLLTELDAGPSVEEVPVENGVDSMVEEDGVN